MNALCQRPPSDLVLPTVASDIRPLAHPPPQWHQLARRKVKARFRRIPTDIPTLPRLNRFPFSRLLLPRWILPTIVWTFRSHTLRLWHLRRKATQMQTDRGCPTVRVILARASETGVVDNSRLELLLQRNNLKWFKQPLSINCIG